MNTTRRNLFGHLASAVAVGPVIASEAFAAKAEHPRCVNCFFWNRWDDASQPTPVVMNNDGVPFEIGTCRNTNNNNGETWNDGVCDRWRGKGWRGDGETKVANNNIVRCWTGEASGNDTFYLDIETGALFVDHNDGKGWEMVGNINA